MINLGAEHENLDQKAYSILKNLIIERKLLPGQKSHRKNWRGIWESVARP